MLRTASIDPPLHRVYPEQDEILPPINRGQNDRGRRVHGQGDS